MDISQLKGGYYMGRIEGIVREREKERKKQAIFVYCPSTYPIYLVIYPIYLSIYMIVSISYKKIIIIIK
jgi:hypothetical protein